MIVVVVVLALVFLSMQKPAPVYSARPGQSSSQAAGESAVVAFGSAFGVPPVVSRPVLATAPAVGNRVASAIADPRLKVNPNASGPSAGKQFVDAVTFGIW